MNKNKTTPSESFTMAYEERFVAFIDILGFKDLIDRSVGPIRSITPEEIREALEIPKPAGTDQIIIGRIGDISESGHRMSAFSDCIAITVHPTEQGLLHLLSMPRRSDSD
jgi:hypothetical protein